jgi:phospholipid/cholesterol/gamma-HCH transport system substrate-binding protein
MSRVATAVVTAVVVVVAAILVIGGKDDPYRLRMELKDAAGLRAKSAVAVGGLKVGRVASVELDDRDRVFAVLEIDAENAPVGKDVSAAITSVNLLGQKQVELVAGNPDDPAPSGYRIPPDRTIPATDLDEVLNVLDPDTRARLAIFLKESGIGFDGRKAELSGFIGDLPQAFSDAQALVAELVNDNRTLGHLVETSDAFVGELAAKREDLTEMVAVLRRSAAVAAERRAELGATIDQAPGTLLEAQRFLTRLEATTVPLGPAARVLSATAPTVSDTLDRLQPFRRDAEPALSAAVDVAPALTRLAKGAAPVLGSVLPPVNRLADFTEGPVPRIGNTLDGSVDNIIAIATNWAHAIQFRDGISHIFRGEVALSGEALRSMVGRLVDPPARGGSGGKRGSRPEPSRPDETSAPQTGATPPAARPDLPLRLPKLPDLPLLGQVDQVLTHLGVKPPTGNGGGTVPPGNVTDLLDFLLRP